MGTNKNEKPTQKRNQDMAVPLMAGVGVGPTGNKPRAARPTEVTRNQSQSTEPQEDNQDDVSKSAEPKKLTYEQRLEEAGIPIDEARAVVDAVLLDNYYEEEYVIANSYTAVLRTRSYGDTVRLMNALEVEKPDISVHVNDMVARYNVAASLSRYNDTDLPARNYESEAEDSEVLEARMRFLRQLPSIAMARLMDATAKFDRKIALVFSEGSVEDF